MEHIFITFNVLTQWGRVTHIYVGKLTTIASDNGLSPGWRQTIIWTNAGILLIGLLGTSFSEISNEIQTFSFEKMHLKMSSAKWRPFCVGLNVLKVFRWVQVCKIVAQVVLKRHDMMTLSNENIFRVTGHLCGEYTGHSGEFCKDQWRGSLMFSLICSWTNGWVNNRSIANFAISNILLTEKLTNRA